MSFSVRIYDRNNKRMQIPAGVRLTPSQWAAEAMGGPSRPDGGAAFGRRAGDAEPGVLAARRIEIVSDGATVWVGEVDARARDNGRRPVQK